MLLHCAAGSSMPSIVKPVAPVLVPCQLRPFFLTPFRAKPFAFAHPNLAAAWLTRGIVSIYVGEYAAGIEQLTRVLRLNPLDPESFRFEAFLGWAHLLGGKYEEAARWANLALTHQPSGTAAMRVSAAANALAGNISEARKISAAMLQLVPTLSISYLKSISPFRRSQDVERVLEGWRLAGLPE